MRPIAMTTLAAILTLMPLALALGQGSAMQQPLAIAIIAGLILQFPLVLLAMPVLYGALQRLPAKRQSQNNFFFFFFFPLPSQPHRAATGLLIAPFIAR